MLTKIPRIVVEVTKVTNFPIHSAQLTLYNQKSNVPCTHSTASFRVPHQESSSLVYRMQIKYISISE